MVDNSPKKNERLRGRNYKYQGNFIIEANSLHEVSEYDPKVDTSELLEKGKENRFDEPKQRDDTIPKKNEN